MPCGGSHLDEKRVVVKERVLAVVGHREQERVVRGERRVHARTVVRLLGEAGHYHRRQKDGAGDTVNQTVKAPLGGKDV